MEEDTAMRDKMEAAGRGSLLPKYQKEPSTPQNWAEANNPYAVKKVTPPEPPNYLYGAQNTQNPQNRLDPSGSGAYTGNIGFTSPEQ